MLRFSANLSMLFTELDFLDRFKAAKACGFKAVEIQFPYVYPATSIQQALAANDLQLILFNVPADDLLAGGEGLAAVPEKREQFKAAVAQALSYAQVLKPQAINILPGRALTRHREQEYRNTFIDNLAYALAKFSPLGIKTVFEAINTHDMPGFIIHTGQQMLDVLACLKHPDLYLQYDIYHMLMMAEDPVVFFNKYADKIGHIQFADVPGRGQPGTGSADFNLLFSTLEKSAYAGWIGAEYQPMTDTVNSLNWMLKV